MGGGLSYDPNAFKKMESNWIRLIVSIISAGNFSPLIACRMISFSACTNSPSCTGKIEKVAVLVYCEMRTEISASFRFPR